MNPEDLTGTLVLVNPELTDDPVQKQGQLGMIMYADLAKDDMYVTFGKGEQALYSSDALLVFKKPGEIYQELLTHTRDIEIPDLKALYRIGMLLDSNRGNDVKDAMKLAAENPGTHARAMISLMEKLGPELDIAPSQQQQTSQQRGR